jgi:hypothetical protein
MSVQLQQQEAKRDLQVISQRQGEKINEYYHRIRSCWQKAKTPEDDIAESLYIVIVKVLH